jgi:hypothetical protein
VRHKRDEMRVGYSNKGLEHNDSEKKKKEKEKT